MAAGLLLEFAVSSWQRLALGMVQAPGTMYHQNLLGMIIHFVDLPAFALLMSGQSGRLLAAAVPAGLAVTVLTGSRGTLAFSLLGYAILFVLSSLRGWTARKRKILMFGAAGLAVIIPVAIMSLDKRFDYQAELITSDYDERAAFEKAARMMLSDNPLGQGANHYVIAANLGGYNNRAGVAMSTGSEGANVHNVYFLVAAETGYPGLIAFILMLLRPLVVAMLCGWDHRNDRRGDLLIGLGVALLTVYVQISTNGSSYWKKPSICSRWTWDCWLALRSNWVISLDPQSIRARFAQNIYRSIVNARPLRLQPNRKSTEDGLMPTSYDSPKRVSRKKLPPLLGI